MFTKKMALAACIGTLSATVLASNAFAVTCAELTGNQLLAAIERGQCTIETASNSTKVVVDKDRWIRTSRNGGVEGSDAGAKSGGGYGGY